MAVNQLWRCKQRQQLPEIPKRRQNTKQAMIKVCNIVTTTTRATQVTPPAVGVAAVVDVAGEEVVVDDAITVPAETKVANEITVIVEVEERIKTVEAVGEIREAEGGMIRKKTKVEDGVDATRIEVKEEVGETTIPPGEVEIQINPKKQKGVTHIIL